MTTPLVTRHATYLFYPFGFPVADAAAVEHHTLTPLRGYTLNTLWRALTPPLDAPPDHEPLWQPLEPFLLATELHPHLRRLFGLSAEPTGPLFAGCRPLHLHAASRRWLAQLALPLPSAAAARLGWPEPAWLSLRLEDAHLYLFASGVGIVLLKLSYGEGEVAAQVLLEGNTLCSCADTNAPQLYWQTERDGYQPLGRTLPELVALLMPAVQPAFYPTTPELAPLPVTPGEQLFSYTVASFAQSWPTASARLAFAYRLSRKYLNDYLPSTERLAEGGDQPFAQVYHAIGLEGGATLIETHDEHGKPIPYLCGPLLNEDIPRAYLPLILLVYQEYGLLLALSQSTYRPLCYGDLSLADREALERYQHRLLDYRLNQLFAHASRNSLQKRFYDNWRTALSLDPMLQEVTNDVNEVTLYLTYKLDQQAAERSKATQQRWEQLSRVYGRFGIAFGALVLFTSFFGMNFNQTSGLNMWDVFSLEVIAVLMTVAATAWFWRRRAEHGLDEERLNDSKSDSKTAWSVLPADARKTPPARSVRRFHPGP